GRLFSLAEAEPGRYLKKREASRCADLQKRSMKMAWITFSMMRRLLVGGGFLFVGLITAVPALAQSEGKDDLSDRQRRLQEVQAQKIDADVRTALREATNLADPVQALEKLRALQSKLADDSTLTAKRKETLIRVIKD